MCRYLTRPAIANERLALNRAGQVVLTRKTPYRDGTTHVVMSPLELMQSLAALVPRRRCISCAPMACSLSDKPVKSIRISPVGSSSLFWNSEYTVKLSRFQLQANNDIASLVKIN